MIIFEIKVYTILHDFSYNTSRYLFALRASRSDDLYQ